ncbi:MAG: LacI family DNA-binding transcriptional regulator [Verrucomicrobiota bacterium JB024]|nr:LacI family DNA-binding transcriptional regulator [Verrucomicrobiota bacterium JB024]
MRVSLRAIAAETGLNVSTVSRALRNSSRVNAETRLMVQEVAEKLGYIRDPLLAAAMTFARKPDKPVYRETIAFLTFSDKNDYTKTPWLRGVHTGVSEQAAKMGYSIEHCRISSQPERQFALGRQLLARGIRGCIVYPTTPDLEQRTVSINMNWDQIAGVEIGHALVSPVLPCVIRNQADDMQMMLSNLHKRGYRRIGLAVSRADEEKRRWAVHSACMLFSWQHAEVSYSAIFAGEDNYTRDSFLRWLNREHPDVLIINGPGVLQWLSQAGIAVPHDIGLCRIDSDTTAKESGLVVDYVRFGTTAVNQLVMTLERASTVPTATESPGALTLSLPSTWHEGETLRAPAQMKVRSKRQSRKA